MRGLFLIIGYIVGNEKARNFCIDMVKQASCVIDNELKKTPLAKVFIKENKDGNDVQETD